MLDETTPWIDLPDVLAGIAEITSLEAALAVARQFGGTEIYVPREPKPTDLLTQCVGPEDAKKIAEFYGGAHLEVPLAQSVRISERNEAIRRLAAQGKSAAELARMFGMTARNVRRIKNGTAD